MKLQQIRAARIRKLKKSVFLSDVLIVVKDFIVMGVRKNGVHVRKSLSHTSFLHNTSKRGIRDCGCNCSKRKRFVFQLSQMVFER